MNKPTYLVSGIRKEKKKIMDDQNAVHNTKGQ